MMFSKKQLLLTFRLFLVILLFPITLGAGTRLPFCMRHPIFCQIMRNQPGISWAYAKRMSRSIERWASVYELEPERLNAIIAQESQYELGAINKESGDYGLSQINHKTIDAFGFDKDRLLRDMDYSVMAGAKVLADFKRMYGHKEEDWWTRYNSSRTHKRQKYKIDVMRYM